MGNGLVPGRCCYGQAKRRRENRTPPLTKWGLVLHRLWCFGPFVRVFSRQAMTQDDIQELSALVDALRRKINTVAGHVDEIDDRLSDIEAVVDTDLDAIAYEQMTKQDKVREIRAYLYDLGNRAANGRAAMDYREVRTLFNGRPSPGHCYDLMKLSAGAEGFEYDDATHDDRNKRIIVKTDAVNDDAVFHAANKESQQNPA